MSDQKTSKADLAVQSVIGSPSGDAPPPYTEAAPEAAILNETWDLACSPKPRDSILRLGKEGRPIWEQYGPYELTTEGYRLKGFTVHGQSPSPVEVANSEYKWSCPSGTATALLLQSQGEKLTLKAFGKYLVFVQMTEPKWESVESPPSDPMNSLKLECDSQDVF